MGQDALWLKETIASYGFNVDQLTSQPEVSSQGPEGPAILVES